MSTLALEGTSASLPPGEQATIERIRLLQAMIMKEHAIAIGSTPSAQPAETPAQGAPAGDFATALAAATTTGTAGASTGAPGASAEAPGAGTYDAMTTQAAMRNGIDPAVLHGLIQQESGFDPNARSGAGAMGLTQLMPGTASSLGVANPMDPAESIEGGARYLGQMLKRFGGNTTDALAAYNAGPGAVEQYGGVPPYAETQSYVSKVLGYAEAYRRSHPSTTPLGGLA
jgi:soluble lytic murein transglycosylase-like protein